MRSIDLLWTQLADPILSLYFICIIFSTSFTYERWNPQHLWWGIKLHLLKLVIPKEEIIHSEVIMSTMPSTSPMVSILLSMSPMTATRLFMLLILPRSYYQGSTISTSLFHILHIGIYSTSAGQSTYDLHLVYLGHDLLKLRHDFFTRLRGPPSIKITMLSLEMGNNSCVFV